MGRKPLAGVLVSLVLCCGLCLYSLSFRYRSESLNRAVSLVAETSTIEALGAGEGMSLPEALRSLRAKGLVGVVVAEQTVGDLLSDQSLRFGDEDSLANGWIRFKGSASSIVRVQEGLDNRFRLTPGQLEVRQKPGSNKSWELDIHGVSIDLLRSVSVGLDPAACKAAREASLAIIARAGNPLGIDESGIRSLVNGLKVDGASYFLPMGDQVLGMRASQSAFTEALASNNVLYCSPEFAKIAGDPAILAAIPERSIRLHSAQAAEVDKLSKSGYMERYLKAASERGVKILLLRPLSFASAFPLREFGGLIAELARQVRKEGNEVGIAHPFHPPSVPRWTFVAIGLSIAPVALFVFSQLVGVRWMQAAVGLGALALGLGCWAEPLRNFAALEGALAFPIAGFMLLQHMPKLIPVRLLGVAAVALVGGFCVAGLLNDVPYMLRADQFSGVKLAVFLPVLIVGWHFLASATDVGAALRSPILWLQAAIFVGIVAALGFMIARTGNDNPAGVSGLELQLRSLLEQFLVVRPRTKEFLIGYPALVVGLAMLGRCEASPEYRSRWGGWTALALMVGSIGITSLVNTMCHLHTPLPIGLARIAFGLIFGSLIGGGLWFVIGTAKPVLKRIPS